ncbi:hypothetical protein ACFO5K_19460 [Nocardia halotolerans]|uniref:Uncharacterized protein n=1 Tax=Nocardia halotolerans TaxID=1755878 RepID=A0ABV8VL53_9NOCA
MGAYTPIVFTANIRYAATTPFQIDQTVGTRYGCQVAVAICLGAVGTFRSSSQLSEGEARARP